ncbi:MAG TPA: hypothetical protein VFU21_08610 [Kofleriaceae bacterium]|nr:hypothetical protein [Kofleriaceae bacterium]
MRTTARAVLVLAIALSAAAPAIALAEPPASSPAGIGFSEKRPPADGQRRWGDGRTGRGPEPVAEPARGSAYNVTHIVYASLIMLAMLAFTVWLIRRNRRSD